MRWAIIFLGMVVAVMVSSAGSFGQTFIFRVDEKSSFIKDTGVYSKTPPIQVALNPGGYLKLNFRAANKKITGAGEDLTFTTDQLEKSPSYAITGELQTIFLKMNGIQLEYDPQNGKIEGATGTWVSGFMEGGEGNLFAGISGQLVDANSTGIDPANGLGVCDGKISFDFIQDSNEVGKIFSGRIVATVIKEDLNGDGVYENICKQGLIRKPFLEYKQPPFKLPPPCFLRVVFPTPTELTQEPVDREVANSVDVDELFKAATGQPLAGRASSTSVTVFLDDAQQARIFLVDAKGRIYSGDTSQAATKALTFQPKAGEKYRLDIYPAADSKILKEYRFPVRVEEHAPFPWGTVLTSLVIAIIILSGVVIYLGVRLRRQARNL